MPRYDYECPACDHPFEVSMTFAEYDLHKPQPCPECGVVGNRVISSVNFTLSGDDWPGKAIRTKGQMLSNRAAAGVRQKERYGSGPAKLTPNVGGEQTDSWADAQKLAASTGKDATSYDPLVRQERAV